MTTTPNSTARSDSALNGGGAIIDEGNVTDGVLRKTLEAHCRRCGQAALGLIGDYPMAAQELRGMGWVTRQGLWVCQHCAPDTPRGSKFAGAFA